MLSKSLDMSKSIQHIQLIYMFHCNVCGLFLLYKDNLLLVFKNPSYFLIDYLFLKVLAVKYIICTLFIKLTS